VRKIDAAEDMLAKTGALYTDGAVSSAAELPVRMVSTVQKARNSQYIKEYPLNFGDEDGIEFSGRGDEAEPIDLMVGEEDKQRLHDAIGMLSRDEAFVIQKLYLGNTGESYRSVAKQLGCSHERVRKYKMDAFRSIAMALAGYIMYVPRGKAAEELGVHTSTVTRWAKKGKIKYIVSVSGRRKYDINSCGNRQSTVGSRQIVD